MLRQKSLHWVVKVLNLKKTLNFYENVLGMKILRHEEFDDPCEATCNGPYGNKWSKTMIGYGPEKENFALELVYNYGVKKYKFGNDIQYITLELTDQQLEEKLSQHSYDYKKQEQYISIVGPDNLNFRIFPSQSQNRFRAVALRTDDIDNSKKYWIDTLKLSEYPQEKDNTIDGESYNVGFGTAQTFLTFIKPTDGQKVDHAKSEGRIAFACEQIRDFYEAAKASNDTVVNDPLVLPTKGKADVEVTILKDRDGYEICFVGDVGFYDLCQPTYDVIDWSDRKDC